MYQVFCNDFANFTNQHPLCCFTLPCQFFFSSCVFSTRKCLTMYSYFIIRSIPLNWDFNFKFYSFVLFACLLLNSVYCVKYATCFQYPNVFILQETRVSVVAIIDINHWLYLHVYFRKSTSSKNIIYVIYVNSFQLSSWNSFCHCQPFSQMFVTILVMCQWFHLIWISLEYTLKEESLIYFVLMWFLSFHAKTVARKVHCNLYDFNTW